MEKERELISLCRSKVEQILNWGESAEWTNSDFELLSEKIFEKTQVRLSLSTLKRIWGKVKYDNSPTSATLNALANYIGYGSWRDFESAQVSPSVKTTTTHSGDAPGGQPGHQIAKSPNHQIRSPRRLRIISAVAVSIICIALVVILAKGRSRQHFDPSLAKFEHHKVVENDLPNTVVFNYDASAYDADSVFIQQNWDPRRRERVAIDGKQHTSVYYMPGHFLAKLLVNNQIVKEDTVFIETNGWRAMIEKDKVPVYLADTDFRKNGKMIVSSELMREKTGATVFNDITSTFTNVRRFNVKGDAFDFETSLRCTSPAEESACRRVQILLLTTNTALGIPLSTKGCVSEINLMSPDFYKSGKNTDLSAFGCDYLKSENVKCSVRDGLFRIWLNDHLIFSEKQTEDIGDIVGFRIHFEGAAEMEYAKLNGKVIE